MSMSETRQKPAKKLMRDLFDMKKVSRPLFIPLVYRYASRVSRVPVEEMLADPLKLSKSLIMARELFDYDAIMTHYDNYLEIGMLSDSFDWAGKDLLNGLAERKRMSPVAGRPLGSPSEVGRAPAVFEASSMLCEMKGRETPVIGVLNSPVTLVNIMLGGSLPLGGDRLRDLKGPLNDARTLLLDLIKAYCDQRVDSIWLIEEDWSGMAKEDTQWLRPLYDTFWNVTGYYDVKTILAFHDFDPGDMGKYFTMGSDGIFFGGGRVANLSPGTLTRLVDQYGLCAGVGCPLPENDGSARLVEAFLSEVEALGYGLFLSTAFEVGLDVPVELMHGMMSMIKD